MLSASLPQWVRVFIFSASLWIISTRRAAERIIDHFAPVSSEVVVVEIDGNPQYAYDGTAWQPLFAGKALKPGATIRTLGGSIALLKVGESFIKVTAHSRLHLMPETPPEEVRTSIWWSKIVLLRLSFVGRRVSRGSPGDPDHI
jgi:hypothetical protein